MRAKAIVEQFNAAVEKNDELGADYMITLATREGFDEIADLLLDKYRSNFGTSEEFCNALDEYVDLCKHINCEQNSRI